MCMLGEWSFVISFFFISTNSNGLYLLVLVLLNVFVNDLKGTESRLSLKIPFAETKRRNVKGQQWNLR